MEKNAGCGIRWGSSDEKSARKSVLVKSQWTPERKAAMSENRRKAWSDPEFKRRASESIRKSHQRSKAAEGHSTE